MTNLSKNIRHSKHKKRTNLHVAINGRNIIAVFTLALYTDINMLCMIDSKSGR